jgi:hypothetical protein
MTGGKQRSEEDKDRLLVKHAARAISQAAKKVKAFEAMTITRNLKQRREKLLAAKDSDTKDSAAKVEALEASCVADLARVKGLDVKAVLLPRALAKLGLDATLLEAAKGTNGEQGDQRNSSSGEEATGKGRIRSNSNGNDNSGTSHREPMEDGNHSHEEAAVAPLDSATEALVFRLLNHTAMKAAIESMNPAVTLRRCEKLAKAEGRRFSKKEMATPDSSAGFSTAAAPAVNHRAARTTFLTSLSGDAPAEDSDASGDDDEYGSGAVPQVKNRPGQRARQKRHELEEARKAKKEAQKKYAAGQQQSSGQASSSSNVPPSQRGINPLSKAGRTARDSSSNKAQAVEREEWSLKRSHDNSPSDQKPKKKKSENAIHASWEAAKLRREKEAARMVVPAQGKKIVFGEDGGVTAGRPSSAPTKSSAPPRAAAPAAGAVADKQHPSWAAKQAQQAKLAAGFQGKKTTFG